MSAIYCKYFLKNIEKTIDIFCICDILILSKETTTPITNKGEKTMAKKRYYFMELNNIHFRLDTAETKAEPTYRNSDTIHDAYGRPSYTKISIWEKWQRWFYDNGGYCWVASHNSNFFTIEGIVQDEHGYPYYCRITPSNNYCWKISA